MDFYVRFKDQIDNDFCFNVDPSTKIEDLKNIFRHTPSVLAPSYFYRPVPNRFAVSVHPGYLTCKGGMLFAARASELKYLKLIDNEKTVGEEICEGQLLVPIWEHDTCREWTVFIALCLWLYWDLPDFLSPTPGISVISIVARAGGAQMDELTQLCIFGLNVVKVLAIYILLWSGLWHPLTLNMYKLLEVRRTVRNCTVTDLEKLGWTGIKKITPPAWQKYYSEKLMEDSGNIVEAIKSGVLKTPMGLVLVEGMGYSVLRNNTIDDIHVDKNLLDANDNFVVSKEFFKEQKRGLKLKDSAQLIQFRKYGYGYDSELLSSVFDHVLEQSRR